MSNPIFLANLFLSRIMFLGDSKDYNILVSNVGSSNFLEKALEKGYKNIYWFDFNKDISKVAFDRTFDVVVADCPLVSIFLDRILDVVVDNGIFIALVSNSWLDHSTVNVARDMFLARAVILDVFELEDNKCCITYKKRNIKNDFMVLGLSKIVL